MPTYATAEDLFNATTTKNDSFADSYSTAEELFANTKPKDNEKATILWGGKLVNFADIERVAKAKGVSPATIAQLGTASGHIDANLASTAVGQGLLELESGIGGIGETIASSVARTFGRQDISERIQKNKKDRREFLDMVEKGGDIESALGERGSRIFNGVAEAYGKVGGAGFLGGPTAMYSSLIADDWDNGLNEAKQVGLSGTDAIGYAGRKAVINSGMTFLMGQIGKNLGITTFESGLSPATRNAAKIVMEKSGIPKQLQKVVAEAGGIGLDTVEQFMINAGQQANEIADKANGRKTFDWESLLEAGVTGGVARGVSGAVKATNGLLKRAASSLPEVVKGTVAAEDAMGNGAKPEDIIALTRKNDFQEATGQKNTTDQFRKSYREAAQFYLNNNESTTTLAEHEQNLANKTAIVKAPTTAESSAEPAKVEPVVEHAADVSSTEAAPLENQANPFNLKEFEAAINSKAAPATEPIAAWEPRTRIQMQLDKANERLQVSRDKIQEMREDKRSALNLRQDQYKDARELVEEYVPLEERGKYLRGIEKAKTPAQVDSLLNRVVDFVDKRDHNLAKQELQEALNKATNIRSEFAGIPKGIKDAIDFKRFNGRELAQSLKSYYEANPDAIKPADDLAMLRRLEKTPINDMSAEDIRTIANSVQDAAYQSSIKDKFLSDQLAASVKDTNNAIIDEVGKARGYTLKTDDPIRKALTGKEGFTPGLEKQRDLFTLDSPFFREVGERPETTMRRISPKLAEMLWENTGVKAQADYDAKHRDLLQSTSDVLDELGLDHAPTIDSTWQQIKTGKGSTLEAWRTETKNIAGQKLSRDEAAMLHLIYKDPENAKVLDKAGFNFPDGRKTGPFNSRMLGQIEDFIGDQGRALNGWIFRYLNGPLPDAVNETSNKLTGRDLITKRNRVPRIVDQDNYAVYIKNPAEAMTNMAVDSYAHLKKRTGTNKPLTVPEGVTGVVDYFLNHADRMNKYSAFGVAARDSQAVLNDPSVRDAIIAKNGQNGYQHIVDAVRSQVIGSKPSSSIERMIGRHNALTAAGTLGWRLTTLALQANDVFTSASYRSGGIVRALRSVVNAYTPGVGGEMDSILGENSGHYWKRFKSDGFATEQTGGVYQNKGWFRPPAISQHALAPLSAAEHLSIARFNFLSAKDWVNGEGITPDSPAYGPAVAREWERLTYRGSNTSQGIELSGALRWAKDHPILAPAVTFQSTASKMYSLIHKGFDEVDAGNRGAAARTFATIGVGLVVTGLIKDIFSREKIEGNILQRVGKRAILEFTGWHPFGGQYLTEGIVRPMLGMKSHPFGGSAFTENLADLTKGIGEMAEAYGKVIDGSAEPDKLLAPLYKTVRALATSQGIPFKGPEDFGARVKDSAKWMYNEYELLQEAKQLED